jgi:hypothetical protein
MEKTDVSLLVLSTALVLIVGSHLFKKGRDIMARFLASKKEQLNSQNALAKAVSDFARYTEGLVKVCEDQVAQIERLRESVDKFAVLVAPPEARESGFTPQGAEDSEMSYAMQPYLAEGYNEVQALDRAAADLQKKMNAGV